jgi:hypothetical protein
VRTILFQNNVASIAQFTWVVDSDVVLVLAVSTGSVLISSDPMLTQALYTTPTELISIGKDIIVTPCWSSSLTSPPQLNIPLSKDSRLFVNFTASKGSCVLFVEDVFEQSGN